MSASRAGTYSSRLNYYNRMVQQYILEHQDPVSGLIPSQGQFKNHAWVRDNVYTIMCVWALSLALKKFDPSRAYELEQSCVKNMRGLLVSMMRQSHKVEKFKETLCQMDCLHAKYSSVDGNPCVGDTEWGHLQLDATSLYLLTLAQMTASGLQIIFNMDEVAFVQNLVFYIESSYFVPDYGIWERGDKTNHGLPELNASSIGMAKAALEALNDLDLFGGRGGPQSVIQVLADEPQKCDAVLRSMLPRESNSKEVDAAELSIIGFPAFAVSEQELVDKTRDTILEKLQGKYGCKRFLRDGYRTAREDSKRLYYDPWELSMFEDIECEWPLFYCYMVINSLFTNDRSTAEHYLKLLNTIVVKDENGLSLIPEMYAVAEKHIEEEKRNPHSQVRHAVGTTPFLWAQSLYVIAGLLMEGLIAPGELDPLNRRFSTNRKPEIVVQVTILAEDQETKEALLPLVSCVQSIQEAAPVQVRSARVLSKIYSCLGLNEKMELSGRLSTDVGLLSTSKLYTLGGKVYAFLPQNLDVEKFHLVNDIDLFLSTMRSDIAVLKSSWNMLGRPTIITMIRSSQLDNGKIPPPLRLAVKKLLSGYINGTRVTVGTISDFLNTSCLSNLSFLEGQELKPELRDYLDREYRRTYLSYPGVVVPQAPGMQRIRRTGVAGIISRSRSVVGDPGDIQSMQSTGTIGSRVDVTEMLRQLGETKDLDEQGDILHFLATNKGLAWDTGLGQAHSVITVKDLFHRFYHEACKAKKWGLVRHFAASLGKRVEDLAKSLTDLLVRQKQVTVGMPPNNEHTLTRPLSTKEFRAIIEKAHPGDQSTAMLTQELIVYLAMFMNTEPQLFNEMIRLRIGLIIQVMCSELERSLDCSTQDAADALLSLSPFDMQNLLKNILSGREFSLKSMGPGSLSLTSKYFSKWGTRAGDIINEKDDEEDAKRGQWLRRRRLDGALNRVPADFYELIWKVLQRCEAISLDNNNCLTNSLTKEMTPGELKFALRVEALLNHIPEPEYRQMLVEALMILSITCEQDMLMPNFIRVDTIVQTAHDLFLADQLQYKGNSTLCCLNYTSQADPCHKIAGLCEFFIDSAPSGSFGTMTYMLRSVATLYIHRSG
ncbi:probable phosphorylase b kinase regulatory subunit alpha [Galendromus occidentalis]|uniref:Phosphorylase b kinase regulatory subunit n=1 Tax=Galendromus occidentalis TaxID=34638 RepID=A0AAJ6QWB1_9ACAR|nr:probable phosphorylase b kinase regulatory subunit alpha [Galendromus occidentalis]